MYVPVKLSITACMVNKMSKLWVDLHFFLGGGDSWDNSTLDWFKCLNWAHVYKENPWIQRWKSILATFPRGLSIVFLFFVNKKFQQQVWAFIAIKITTNMSKSKLNLQSLLCSSLYVNFLLNHIHVGLKGFWWLNTNNNKNLNLKAYYNPFPRFCRAERTRNSRLWKMFLI